MEEKVVATYLFFSKQPLLHNALENAKEMMRVAVLVGKFSPVGHVPLECKARDIHDQSMAYAGQRYRLSQH